MKPEVLERKQAVRALIYARWFVLGVALALLFVVDYGQLSQPAPYAVLATAAVLNVGYMLALRRVRRPTRFAALQIALDLVLETWLVYLTGGVYSFGAVLYFGSVLAASRYLSGRAGIAVASACSLVLALVQITYYLVSEGLLPRLPLLSDEVVALYRVRAGREAAYLITQALALHAVALLASWLGREIRRVKSLYQEILERMGEGLIAVDDRGRILFINAEARRLLGDRRVDSPVGRPLAEVFRRAEDRSLLEWLEGAEPVTVELDLPQRDADGGTRAIRVKTSELRDERGRLRATIAILTDLTLHKQVEQAQRRAERLEEIETLALGIAHEVRNPLASIRGCVQELGRLSFERELDRRLVDIVCRESDRLDGIIGEFLRFARLREPEPAPLDLAALLDEVVALLRARIPTDPRLSSLRVEWEPPEAGAFVVEADRQLLTQVFLNLGINAFEAMAGSETGRLSITIGRAQMVRKAERRRPVRQPTGGENSSRRAEAREALRFGAAIEVCFRDTGPGIPPELRTRVLTPFFTTKPDGTGLGLALCARIVKAHRGVLSIGGAPGGGAELRVALPVSEPAPARGGDCVQAPGGATLSEAGTTASGGGGSPC